jgi:hypothetical protein
MYYREVLSYTISFLLVTLIGVYGINLPGLITGEKKLVYEYYNLNWKFFIPFDYILILIYLLSAYYIGYLLNLNTHTKYLFTLICATILISGGFMMYFLSKPMSNNFFSQWFHTVTYRAVIYDIILLSFIYLVYVQINSYIKSL